MHTRVLYSTLENNLKNITYHFPTIDNHITLFPPNEIEDCASETRPILDNKICSLIDKFLLYKQKYSNNEEKEYFSKLNKISYISRLLQCRPLVFFNSNDSWFTKSGRNGNGWKSEGSIIKSLPLSEYLSYDEIQISALIGMSTSVHFINNGSRGNSGKKGTVGSFEERGIYIGLVGARFEVPNKMEWEHMLVTKSQNTIGNGYGTIKHHSLSENSQQFERLQLWAEFYDSKIENEYGLPLYSDAINDKENYLPLYNGEYLNIQIYKKRMEISIKTFLLEANLRAKEKNKKAYTHCVGLGLGVWMISPEQGKYMIQVYGNILNTIEFPDISDIDFSWFPSNSETYFNLERENVELNSHINIHFSKRNPAAPLNDNDKLLVASYAWDGNSYPGNEYWLGLLSASGDPAAACCSTIPFLQNPDINPNVSGNTAITFINSTNPTLVSDL